MPTGRIAAAALAAITNTTLYTVPSAKTAVVTINVCNTGNVPTTVRLAIGATGSPAAGEWIEYNTSVPQAGVLERAGIVLGADQRVIAYASTTGVNINIWGYEE